MRVGLTCSSLLLYDCTHQSLDATWISSLSWYFLVVYGIRGIQILLMGDGTGASCLLLHLEKYKRVVCVGSLFRPRSAV